MPGATRTLEEARTALPETFQREYCWSDTLTSDFQPPELWENKCLLFWAIQSVVICYGSFRKLIHRRIPNNSCTYSALKEGEHNSLLIRHRLCIVTPFQNVQYGKRKQRVTTVGKPEKHYISQVIKANINSHQSCWCNMIWCNGNGEPCGLPPNNPVLWEKRWTKTIGEQPTKYLTSSSQNCQGHQQPANYKKLIAKRRLRRNDS